MTIGKTTSKKSPAKKAIAKKEIAKKAIAKKAPAKDASTEKEGAKEKRPRVFSMSFASVYPLYLAKVERKGRTAAELDEVIAWLTGYRGAGLERAIASRVDLERFFAEAPRMNANARLITGVVCGVRVEEVADPLMKQIRYLDKLVDELAQGKKMAAILRA